MYSIGLAEPPGNLIHSSQQCEKNNRKGMVYYRSILLQSSVVASHLLVEFDRVKTIVGLDWDPKQDQGLF